ncbi:MAG: Mur ligase family protein [Bacilli bacterium]
MDVGVPVLVVNDTLKALQRIAKLHRLRFENPVVGITGSCGKTSTKEMLAKLASWKNPLATKGNLNNQLGVPLTLTQIDLRQNQLAIVEAGVSAPGQMKELAEMIEPDIAIITNVGLAHLEGFSEVGNVAKERRLSPQSRGGGEDGASFTITC